jgi:hypothetical protein
MARNLGTGTKSLPDLAARCKLSGQRFTGGLAPFRDKQFGNLFRALP